MSAAWRERLRRVATDDRIALVTILATEGSAPRGPGTRMVVDDAASFDTIGGGALEHQAIEQARAILSYPPGTWRVQDYPLGPLLGQCCGGRVRLLIERVDPAARDRALAAQLGVREIVAQGKSVRFAPVDLPESARMKVTRLYPGTVLKPATRTIVVPAPGTNRMGGAALSGEEVVRWAEVLLHAVVEGDAAYETEATTYRKRR